MVFLLFLHVYAVGAPIREFSLFLVNSLVKKNIKNYKIVETPQFREICIHARTTVVWSCFDD